MRLSVFICFMLIAAIVTAIGSYFAGSGFWVIVLRVVAVLVVLQTAYFLLALVSGLVRPRKPKSSDARTKTKGNDPLVGRQKQ